MTEIRSRFAPSPTGYLHIGGARTALFSWLFARGQGGKFVLRIEDTDRERSTPESVQAILDGLGWLGIDWDEGPFFQSERMALYREGVDELLRRGRAYRCFCAAQDLDRKREAAQRDGRKPAYDRTCRARLDEPDLPFTIRFKAPLDGETRFRDLIKGPVAFQNEELDDLIIARSDGSPTYNFCVVIDDSDMRISHVIRGEDHLNNTPKQIQMYEALDRPLPEFAHVPLILGLDRARLSKRFGATAVTAYRDQGLFPEAVVNYLARLGWSHGDQELFTREELIEKFRVEDVGKSAGVFDPEKLEWVNSNYMKTLPLERVVSDLEPVLAASGHAGLDPTWVGKMVATLRERARTLVEVVELGAYFLTDEITIDPAAAAKFLKPEIRPVLEELAIRLARIESWEVGPIEKVVHVLSDERSLKLGKIAQPVRVAVTGGTASPGIFETLEVIGRDRTLRRLRAAAESIVV